MLGVRLTEWVEEDQLEKIEARLGLDGHAIVANLDSVVQEAIRRGSTCDWRY